MFTVTLIHYEEEKWKDKNEKSKKWEDKEQNNELNSMNKKQKEKKRKKEEKQQLFPFCLHIRIFVHRIM